MIVQDHEIADAEFGVNAARCIGYQQRLDTHGCEDSSGIDHFVGLKPFIVVGSSAEHCHGHRVPGSDPQSSLMPRGAADREARQVSIGELPVHRNGLRDGAKATAENDGQPGPQRGPA